MAKDKSDGVSESKPGGVKASDLPKSVGGTKDTGTAANALPNTEPAKNAEADKLSPVTTDAAASTPTPPTSAAEPFAPSKMRDSVPARAEGGPHFDESQSGFKELELDAPGSSRPVARTGVMSLMDTDENITVRDFYGTIEEFIDAAKNREWSKFFQAAGRIVLVFSDLMDRNAVQEDGVFGMAAPTAAKSERNVDRLGVQLAAVRNDLSQVVASRGPQWSGGEPLPVSGAAAPMGRVRGSEATTINPQTILVAYELVLKIWEMLRTIRK